MMLKPPKSSHQYSLSTIESVLLLVFRRLLVNHTMSVLSNRVILFHPLKNHLILYSSFDLSVGYFEENLSRQNCDALHNPLNLFGLRCSRNYKKSMVQSLCNILNVSSYNCRKETGSRSRNNYRSLFHCASHALLSTLQPLQVKLIYKLCCS